MTSGTVGGWMAPSADAAWRAANAASAELGHSWVGTEHLLLGLLAGPADDAAVMALTEHGVSAAAVLDALAREGLGRGPDDKALLTTLGVDLDLVRARVGAAFGFDALHATG